MSGMSEGKRPAWESLKPTLGQSLIPNYRPRGPNFSSLQMPPPPLLRVGQLLPEWHRLVSDQGRIPPPPPPPKRLVSLGEVRQTPIFGFRRFSPFLSDLDWWIAGVLVSQAGERLQGDVSLESNAFLLDTLAQKSQDHKALTLPPPKWPAQTLTTLVSSKRPKQNPQPTGRGRVKFKVKGRFPGLSAHRGKGRGANKGRNVHDVRIPACMKAPEVPPLTVLFLRLSGPNFGPITRENSREAIKILEKIGGGGGLVRDRCRPLGYAHRTMGVQDPPCDAAATETSGTRDHIPQGVLRVVVSEPVSARAAEQGSDRANFTLPGCYSRLFLVRKATGEWRPIIRSVLPQVFSCIARASLWKHLGHLQGPSAGPVVNLPRPERRLLSYRVDPADRRCSVTTAPLGSSQYCHSGCQPV